MVETMTPVELWLVALRSGEYQQARGALRTPTGYCCLGVACDLYMKQTGDGRWENWTGASLSHQIFSASGEGHETEPPTAVRNWLGLSGDIGQYTEWQDDGKVDTALTEKNDMGATFSEIADIIESRPEGLFNADTP